MKKILLSVGLIILIACAAGWVLTYHSLSTTQSTLRETQADLHNVQVKLQDTEDNLEETQDELQDTTESLENTQQSLEETEQGLDEQKGETQKYVQLYERNLEELNKTEAELDALKVEFHSSQQENQDLQDTIDELQEKLALYEDTLGVKVFSGIIPPYTSGNLTVITLTNQSTAENPTWEQLKAFLKEDKTDKKLYVPDVYMCGGFAQDLHNNAEVQGIRAAFVVIYFDTGLPHALNAFKTLDEGLVYIDTTGDTKPVPMANQDRRMIIKKGEPYRGYWVFPERGVGMKIGDEKVIGIEIYW